MTENPKRPATGNLDVRGLNARKTALALLREVLDQGRPLDEALAANPYIAKLEARDRAFARLLLATTLRRLGQIDAALAHCLDRPIKAKDVMLQHLLRLGATQLLFLETPPHAAVSTTLDLAKGPRLAGQRGLLNAVLRRLSREGREIVAAQDAARLNTPDWLWEPWSAAYGETAARAIAEAHLGEPPLDLTCKENPEAWAEKLEATVLPTGSLRLTAGQGDVARLPGYAEGVWWVQDAAAALPAHLLGDIAGKSVIDLCAAPGGKTAQLAASGAEVIAVERAEGRLKRLQENLQRLKLGAATVSADAATWQPPEAADAVLLDAPCSATGTLRRHPDIAWLKGGRDVTGLTKAQDKLLAQAVKMVKPGGLLVYAVCSLQPEEGPERIAALLASAAPVERVAVTPAELPGLEAAITPEGDLRTLPCHWADKGGLDGFYACRLRRV
ncbi:RsmB/NOP family class I SAM-dependent RNA methyltransferase [Pelagibius marinus]|uniref:RsmB/NOP family class I SAM-dependent RNA methyltransferase n=1 Tax=Pelagibius marinus TaxID=2762760 RepID=UPI001872DE65|nr:transcription antitermination factor NusB [Pelagibius marinus]